MALYVSKSCTSFYEFTVYIHKSDIINSVQLKIFALNRVKVFKSNKIKLKKDKHLLKLQSTSFNCTFKLLPHESFIVRILGRDVLHKMQPQVNTKAYGIQSPVKHLLPSNKTN